MRSYTTLSDESQNKLIDRISEDEGFSAHVYRDQKGFLTIGFGFNLDSSGIPFSIAEEWLKYNVNKIGSQLANQIYFWKELNDARKCVLINMAYQMGVGGVLGFHGMLSKLGSKDYEGASSEMMDSVWYREFTSRASRLVKIMVSGEL